MPTADYEKKVNRVFEMVEESDTIHPENADLLRAYRRDKELNGMSAAAQQRNLSYMKIVAEHVGDTRFEDMDTEDVKTLIEWLHDRDIAAGTVETYKKVIRQFWTWMNDGDAPEEVAWLTVSSDASSGTLPQDLLTKHDVEDQIAAAKNPRDKAFIAVLYETGARIGELIDLTIGDIEDRKHGKKITIDGKTGARRLPLVESVPYLNKWLNAHPTPQKDAPLWCKIQQGGPDDQLGYNYLRQKVLEKNMERAGIDKPSNPHHYRHSRASYLANEMTEAQLCEWFGWVQGSDVPARYVHLSGRDIDNTYDALHGLYEPDEDDEEASIIECPRCEELNEPGAAFCMRCGQALNIDAAEELERAEAKVTETASETDAALALKLVEAIHEDKEDVAELVEQLQ